jgi:hypothetical protein
MSCVALVDAKKGNAHAVPLGAEDRKNVHDTAKASEKTDAGASGGAAVRLVRIDAASH